MASLSAENTTSNATNPTIHPSNEPDAPTSAADPSVESVEAVEKALETSISTGLSSAEAARRLEKFGPNALVGAPPVPAWKRFLLQFKDPLVYLLIAATVISFAAWLIERAHGGSEEAVPFDAIVIILILILNAVLGYLQESKAEQAVDALAQMTEPTASVLRGGRVVRIPTADIVPGDVLVLAEGDTVAADGRLFAAASLRIAEASLTGESVPIAKSPAALESIKALGDRTNMVFNGTAVTQGTGRAIVTSTGMRTQVGKIADMLSVSDDGQTPLQKEMAHVSTVLGIAVCAIAALVIVVLAVAQGFHTFDDVINSLLLAVSLAVAAVPEGLATILTVVLALGVQRMAAHNAIVKKLSSVETLGSASVICSDKTGTLTRNEMTVEAVLTPSGRASLTGTGYAPLGDLVDARGQDIPQSSALRAEVANTLEIGALANDAQLLQENDEWTISGDPTEAALIVAARKIGADRDAGRYSRVAEIPFTSERKRMTVIVADSGANGELRAVAKGAPDVLLSYCTRIAVGNHVRTMTEGERQEILAQVESLSRQAYRTLGQAYRPLGVSALADIEGVHANSAADVDIAEQADAIEKDLIWAGLVGIIDPPRVEVRDSVKQAHRAGVRTVMITGDHPLTAQRIATDLGIAQPDSLVMTGDDLDAVKDDPAALDEKTANVSVYARVAPEHKLIIVDSLQRQGNIVAMTGDGVNDAPAVKSADIGVAMGITGTEVTKQSAKMILADDNFSTIVAAIAEGRVIFENIRKFLRFLLASNMGEVLTVFLGVLLAGFIGLRQPGSTSVTVPLLAVQLLWVNLLTDGAPAIALGMDKQAGDVMNREPRSLKERAIDAQMWRDIFFVGIVMAIVVLIGMDLHLPGGLFTERPDFPTRAGNIVEARTIAFTVLVFSEMFLALSSRSAYRSAFDGMFTNRWLWGSMALSVLLQLAVIYIPGLNAAFGTVPLPPEAWLECVLLSSVLLWATELRKSWLRAGLRKRGLPIV